MTLRLNLLNISMPSIQKLPTISVLTLLTRNKHVHHYLKPTADAPSTYVVAGYENDYNDGYEDMYGRRDTISVVDNGGGNVNYNTKNWDSWNEEQVSSWVENKLLKELNFDNKEVSEL